MRVLAVFAKSTPAPKTYFNLRLSDPSPTQINEHWGRGGEDNVMILPSRTGVYFATAPVAVVTIVEVALATASLMAMVLVREMATVHLTTTATPWLPVFTVAQLVAGFQWGQ